MLERIKEYRNTPAVNQSLLVDILHEGYLEDKEEERYLYHQEKDYFLIGEAVETKLLMPELFEEEFYVSELQKKPSELICSIVQQTFAEGKSIDQCLESARKHGYQPNWKDETLVKKIIEEGSEYYDELEASRFKKILSQADKDRIDIAVERLQNNPATGTYFKDMMRLEVQVPIYFKLDGVFCKALLDFIYHEDDGSYTPVDIKTLFGHAFQFRHSAKARRYDIQGAFYTKALQTRVPNVNLFTFLAASSTKDTAAVKYIMTEQDLDIAYNGKDNIKGIKEALSIYKDLTNFAVVDSNHEALVNNYELNLNLYV